MVPTVVGPSAKLTAELAASQVSSAARMRGLRNTVVVSNSANDTVGKLVDAGGGEEIKLGWKCSE